MILRRLEGKRNSEVLREWNDGVAVLIGGGASLTLDQVAQVKAAHSAGRVHAIAVNDAYLWADFADVLYFADLRFWQWHHNGTPKPRLNLDSEQVKEKFHAFAGQKCSIIYGTQIVDDESVHLLINMHEPMYGDGLSEDPTKLVTGRHSGYQALNIAILAGAKKIILLGYDGGPMADGGTHFSGGHPKPTPPEIFEYMRKAFSASERAIEKAGVEVVNCSPHTRIDAFEKKDIAQALAGV